MKLLLVNDNTRNQTNGVVTTFKGVLNELEGREILTYHVTPDHFRHFGLPGYPDVRITMDPWNLKSVVDWFKPTHVHIATEGVLGHAARRLCQARGWRYSTSFHTRWDSITDEMVGFGGERVRRHLRWFHSQSHSVLATTEGMKSLLEGWGFERVITWTRGVDKTLFSFRVPTDHPRPVLLNVGRVSVEKNLDTFCQLDPSKYDLRLVGDGPSLPRLKSLYPHVSFLGELKGESLAQQYQDADCFVFPSRSDTFGLVMIESMSTGTPVAAYPVQGPIDVVEQGVTGYVDEDLERAVDRCLGLDRHLVERGSQRWTWKNTADIFLNSLVEI